MSLIGNHYITPSSEDPGSVGFGYYWDQSDTGLEFVRNTSNTAWTFVGNTATANMGNVSVTSVPEASFNAGYAALLQLAQLYGVSNINCGSF